MGIAMVLGLLAMVPCVTSLLKPKQRNSAFNGWDMLSAVAAGIGLAVVILNLTLVALP